MVLAVFGWSFHVGHITTEQGMWFHEAKCNRDIGSYGLNVKPILDSAANVSDGTLRSS